MSEYRLRPIDFIENRRVRERMGLEPAPPYPYPWRNEPLKLRYGDTSYFRLMVARAAKREREGK